ncbi:MAG: hypothetical protein QGG54_19325, partial [Gammaproteobacteria bacterium]|nr:hypothetical protein [Gammaproteobacteria bacterium]
MKKFLHLSVIAILISTTNSLFAGERIGDFSLIDHLGTQHHMAWYDDQSAIVILPQANGSTDSEAVAALADLQSRFATQGVVFFLMNPGLQSDRAAIGMDAAVQTLGLPVLMDDTQLVSESLGIARLDEAVVYDPKSFELLYRGPVNTQLVQAVQGLIDGESGDLVAVASAGASIDYSGAGASSAPSYTNDVAPIVVENCANCHREGGIAPFAMDSKLAMQGWSPMIREVIMTRRMPPGQIDNKVGHKIKGEMNLSDADQQTLVRWVDAGSPLDGDTDPLVGLVWPDTKWTLGEPDLIVAIPPTAIPATGV